MGSTNSRLGSAPSRPSRPRVNRRKRRLSPFLCGSLSPTPQEMEEYPAESSANSAEKDGVVRDDRLKESSLTFCSANECSSSMFGNGTSCESSNNSIEEISVEYNSRSIETRSIETRSSEKFSPERKEPCKENANYHLAETYWERASDTASSSKDLHPLEPASSDVETSLAVVVESDIQMNVTRSQIRTDSVGSGELEDLFLEREPLLENSTDEVLGVHDCGPNSISVVSDSPVSLQSLEDEPAQDFASAAIPGAPTWQRDRRNRSLLHVDVVSISSDSLSGSTEEINNREARRNSRRLFWDAFSRRSSRRRSGSPTIVFSSEDTDDLESHDRWLLDFSGDLFDNRVEDDFGYSGRRNHRAYERRWHSRSEIWERLRGNLDDRNGGTTFCASGLHPDGTCSCETFLMAEETATRASISRIVMLAEALFEVLDEIHRQPVSLSLSMVSLPAPESVVDSFPLKSHTKLSTTENGDDTEQCYICLAEYEEGDKIRVLPCHHEYHMLCIDKWLKEIHGICPLCRGDVCEVVAECSVSNS